MYVTACVDASMDWELECPGVQVSAGNGSRNRVGVVQNDDVTSLYTGTYNRVFPALLGTHPANLVTTCSGPERKKAVFL